MQKPEIPGIIKALKANLFTAEYAEDGEAARKVILDLVPREAVVGLGGSTSVREIGILEALKERGTTVLDPWSREDLDFPGRLRWSMRGCDVFLASSNAVTLDGKLVNVDGSGNRIAGTHFGPKMAILLVGQNKIVGTVDEGIRRIKDIIAPYHNMVRGRKVPCSVTLKCTDCRSPDRSCRVTVITEKQPRHTTIAVVLVGQDLGLGWDPAWPETRREKILATYREEVKKFGGR